VTGRRRLARRPCTWHDCPLLAGSRRDDCAEHITQVCMAGGTVLVARFGAQQPVLPALGGIASAGRPIPRGRRRRKGVIP
jgi:hypothetical protein